MFSLAEEIFLLALLEKKETLRIPSSLSLPFALAGAMIIELALAEAVKVEDGRLLLLPEAEKIETGYLKRVIEKIQKVGKPKRVDYWVYQVGARGNRVTRLILFSLVERGVLQETEKNFRWEVGTNPKSQELTAAKYLLKRGMRDAIYCQSPIDEPTAALLGLMDSCAMLNHLFTEDEIISGRKRVKRLVKGEGISRPFADLLVQIIAGVEYAVAADVSV